MIRIDARALALVGLTFVWGACGPEAEDTNVGVAASAVTAPDPANLVAHWSCDQGSGTTLVNVAPAGGYNGTFQSTPTWTAGKDGGGLLLDGTDNVAIGNITQINGVAKVSLAAWIKRRVPDGLVEIGKQTPGSVGTNTVAIEAWYDGIVWFGVSGGSTYSGGGVALNDTSWHHVAFVYDGTQSGNAARLKGYVDGAPVTLSFQDTIPATTTTNTTPFNIGQIQGTTSDGTVDDIWLFARALSLAEIQGLASTTPPPPDTTAPSVSVTAPLNNATVSGPITVTASASDNVGVAGVQFLLDGANLGAEDPSAPFSVSWNTASSPNGAHTLTARARDAAGNQATSAGVTVTVSNSTSDTTPPSAPTNPAAIGISSSQVNVTWSASTDNVGVTGYRVERCTGASCSNFAQVAAPSTTSFGDSGLAASTTYRYRVRASDAAGNLSGFSTTVSATTQAAQTGQQFGLEWPGNGSTRRMLYWHNPFPIYDATYIFKVYPRKKLVPQNSPTGYYTTFFWGNDGTFTWQGGNANTYYGAHPYPIPAPDGPGQWEISVNSNDYVTGQEVAWDRWYTQAFRAWRESPSITHHEFYYDLPDTTKVLTWSSNDPNWASQNPPVPAIVIGQAPDNGFGASWGGYPGWEEWSGIIRGIQLYSSSLSVADIQAEIATPQSTPAGQASVWYLNRDPRPSDVTDKKAGGVPHNPSWAGTTAFEWSGQSSSDTTPPSVPQGLSVTGVSSSSVSLAWTASTDNVGVAGYRVYRDGVQVGSPAATTFQSTNLAPSTTYTFAVAAFDAAGNTSAQSASVQGTTSAGSPPPGGGLIGAWGFNEGSGTSTADASGNAHPGTLINAPTWVAGKNGQALQFGATDNGNDNDDPRVTIGTTLDIGALPFTFSAWIRPTDFGDWRAIFSKRTSYTLSSMRFDIGLTQGTGDVYITNGGAQLTFGYSPPLGAWTHVAIVDDGTSARLYVNGVLQATLASMPLGASATANVVIGNNGEGPGGDNDPFKGAIDDVRLYSRALSPAEIQADMNIPVP